MYPFPFILPQPWWRTFSFLDNYMSGKHRLRDFVDNYSTDKSDSIKLVIRYMNNVHVSAFFLLHESLDGEPFLCWSGKHRLRDFVDNYSTDKSYSIKLVIRYMNNVHVSAFFLLHESLDGEPFLCWTKR